MSQTGSGPATGFDPRQARRATHRARTFDSGLAAERSAARHYLRAGMRFRAHRWRGAAGEIDIIFADGDQLVFVEVKKARDFDRARLALSPRQMQRIARTAEEYVGGEPCGSLTDMRFDLAMVDAEGRVEILENAFGGA
ncbi:MAG: YraN family protein [Roseivivax sp.]|nr:YraN family protein [Roseivivax sp.]